MKLDEVMDPTMKLKLEISKLRDNDEQQRELITELATKIARLERTMATLIRKLGPQK